MFKKLILITALAFAFAWSVAYAAPPGEVVAYDIQTDTIANVPAVQAVRTSNQTACRHAVNHYNLSPAITTTPANTQPVTVLASFTSNTTAVPGGDCLGYIVRNL